jgi:hypothetical protein
MIDLEFGTREQAEGLLHTMQGIWGAPSRADPQSAGADRRRGGEHRTVRDARRTVLYDMGFCE